VLGGSDVFAGVSFTAPVNEASLFGFDAFLFTNIPFNEPQPVDVVFEEDQEVQNFTFQPLQGVLTYTGDEPAAVRIIGRASIAGVTEGVPPSYNVVRLSIGVGDPPVAQSLTGLVSVTPPDPATPARLSHVTTEIVRIMQPEESIRLLLNIQVPVDSIFQLLIYSLTLSVGRA
jgi:hypothetical protein